MKVFITVSALFTEDQVRARAKQDRNEKFAKLGSDQRGKPESVMLEIQRLGGGVLSNLVEHVGDLTHRMSHHAKFEDFGFDTVSEKIPKLLRSLKSGYGFEREHKENLKNNAEYSKQSIEELNAKYDKLLNLYVKEHSKLKVYNDLQSRARSAAIYAGKQQWDDVIRNLDVLNRVLKKGEKTWNSMASQYNPNYR